MPGRICLSYCHTTFTLAENVHMHCVTTQNTKPQRSNAPGVCRWALGDIDQAFMCPLKLLIGRDLERSTKSANDANT